MTTRPVHILVVDDNDDDICQIREVIGACDLPIALETASDGEMALTFLRGESGSAESLLPDLVLLDIRMPKKDGLEVLQEIRSDPILHGLPVVMLTSLSDLNWLEEGFLLGANGYLTKPVAQSPLLDALRLLRAEHAGAAEIERERADRPLVFLIADDNEDDRIIMREAVKECRLPHVAYAVHDGEEAVGFLKGRGMYRDAPRPDFVILDLRMPRRDGIDVLRVLQRDPALRGIKSIIVTGYGPQGWIEKEWTSCADAIINKPVSSLSLHDVVHSLLVERVA
jgi:CheY-like chemotaxis protein